MHSGKIIALEGIDGSGKTTQALLIKNALEKKGYKVALCHIPTNTVLGGILKDVLRRKIKMSPKAQALLFTADRIEEYENKIKPLLKKGYYVISERYTLASLIYQTMQGVQAELILDLIEHIPRPDYKIILDISAQEALRRIKKRDSPRQPNEYFIPLKKARNKYLKLGRFFKYNIINGKQDRLKIRNEILKIIINK